MGSFHQWFDRDKLKEIFRTHWGSFKEQFSRYRASRYDEVVKKMLGWEHPPNPNNRRNLWCSFWFWHPTPCPRLAIRAFYNHLGNLRCGLQRFSTAGRKCSIPIPIGKRSRTCRQQEWLCRVLKGIAEVESEMQKPVIILISAGSNSPQLAAIRWLISKTYDTAWLAARRFHFSSFLNWNILNWAL